MRRDGTHHQDPEKHHRAGATPRQEEFGLVQGRLQSLNEYTEKGELEGEIAQGGVKGGVDIYVSGVRKTPQDENLQGKSPRLFIGDEREE